MIALLIKNKLINNFFVIKSPNISKLLYYTSILNIDIFYLNPSNYFNSPTLYTLLLVTITKSNTFKISQFLLWINFFIYYF